MRLNRSGPVAALVVTLSMVWPSFTLMAFAANKAVSIITFSYLPKAVQVNVGDTITWTNNDIAPHSATAVGGAWDTTVMNPGSPPKTLTFNVPGTFNYQCSIHGATMTGTVTVVGQAPPPTAPPPTAPPTVAATPIPTAPPTSAPTTAPAATSAPSPAGSPTASATPTASPSPAPFAAASPTAAAATARPVSPVPDPPDVGTGPGPVLAGVAVIAAVALAGLTVVLLRRR